MRPITALLADDGTVFLPVEPTGIWSYPGADRAAQACQQHEETLRAEQ